MTNKTPTTVSGRLVERVQFHVGYGDTAKTGCHAEKDQAHIELIPPGVFIKKKDGEWLVPYANTLWAKLKPIQGG